MGDYMKFSMSYKKKEYTRLRGDGDDGRRERETGEEPSHHRLLLHCQYWYRTGSHFSSEENQTVLHDERMSGITRTNAVARFNDANEQDVEELKKKTDSKNTQVLTTNKTPIPVGLKIQETRMALD